MPEIRMPDPSRLAVSPSAVADAARQLRALQIALDAARTHLAGPRPAPPVGDAACGLAYESAAHQLGGLVTAAADREHALARSLTAAAALYAGLDGSGVSVQR